MFHLIFVLRVHQFVRSVHLMVVYYWKTVCGVCSFHFRVAIYWFVLFAHLIFVLRLLMVCCLCSFDFRVALFVVCCVCSFDFRCGFNGFERSALASIVLFF